MINLIEVEDDPIVMIKKTLIHAYILHTCCLVRKKKFVNQSLEIKPLNHASKI